MMLIKQTQQGAVALVVVVVDDDDDDDGGGGGGGGGNGVGGGGGGCVLLIVEGFVSWLLNEATKCVTCLNVRSAYTIVSVASLIEVTDQTCYLTQPVY